MPVDVLTADTGDGPPAAALSTPAIAAPAGGVATLNHIDVNQTAPGKVLLNRQLDAAGHGVDSSPSSDLSRPSTPRGH